MTKEWDGVAEVKKLGQRYREARMKVPEYAERVRYLEAQGLSETEAALTLLPWLLPQLNAYAPGQMRDMGARHLMESICFVLSVTSRGAREDGWCSVGDFICKQILRVERGEMDKEKRAFEEAGMQLIEGVAFGRKEI